MATEAETELESSEPSSALTADVDEPERRERGARRPRIRCSAPSLSCWSGSSASIYSATEFELLPSPAAVASQMWDYVVGNPEEGIAAGTVFVAFWETFRQTLYGFAAAFALGVPIGILMGRYRYAKNFFFDLVYLAANIPLIVYAILGLMLFGLGDAGPAFVVTLLVLPVIALNVAAGVESVDRNLLAMSRAYHRPASAAMWHIVVPSFAPFLFAASRGSFAASWKLAALAETFGGTVGVGSRSERRSRAFR